MMRGYGGYGFQSCIGGGFFPFTMIFNVVILIILVVVGVKLYKKYISGTDNSTAIKILNEKYASGDITEEEYSRRREILLNKNKK